MDWAMEGKSTCRLLLVCWGGERGGLVDGAMGRGEWWCWVLGLAIGLVCGEGVGFGLATVWRMVM